MYQESVFNGDVRLIVHGEQACTARSHGCSGWRVSPDNKASAWGIRCSTASSECTAAAGLPGRLMMRLSPRVPETARLIEANGVSFNPWLRISSPNPSRTRSHIERVASGVTSRGVIPVPPVVTTSRARDACSRRAEASCSRSSGTIKMRSTENPASRRRAETSGPDRSSRRPAKQESLTVMTTAFTLAILHGRKWLRCCCRRCQ